MSPDDLLTTEELAADTKRPVQWFAQLRMTPGAGPPFIKLGRLIRYRRSDYEAWLARCQRTSTQQAALEPADAA
jgi:predicted DNA-binding transcriptional regulator AlpA